MPEYIVTSIVPIDSLEELIRCKDCAKNGTDDCSMYFEDGEKIYQWNHAYDFCSWAERKWEITEG